MKRHENKQQKKIKGPLSLPEHPRSVWLSDWNICPIVLESKEALMLFKQQEVEIIILTLENNLYH